jgi:hypothetical protein
MGGIFVWNWLKLIALYYIRSAYIGMDRIRFSNMMMMTYLSLDVVKLTKSK